MFLQIKHLTRSFSAASHSPEPARGACLIADFKQAMEHPVPVRTKFNRREAENEHTAMQEPNPEQVTASLKGRHERCVACDFQGSKPWSKRGLIDRHGLPCFPHRFSAFVPKPMTSNARAGGRFDRSDFICIAMCHGYQCPAGEPATCRFSAPAKKGLNLHLQWTSACPGCALKERCTPSSYRRFRRWEHESVIKRMHQQVDRKPDAMTLRRRTVEYVFVTPKHWMGSTHLLTKTLTPLSTEMSLQALPYNLKRLIRIQGAAEARRPLAATWLQVTFANALKPKKRLLGDLRAP